MQTRWSSPQFDDDLNQFRLRSYFAADVFVSHAIVPRLEATLAIENIFDRRIEAAATPVIALAGPRAVRVGVRYAFGVRGQSPRFQSGDSVAALQKGR